MQRPFLIAMFLGIFVSQAYTQTAVTINLANRIKTLTGVENGINLNYLMDGGFTSPSTSNATALKNMGVKLLRYPGGEKADNYLWSAAPWAKASPRMALLDTVNAWPTDDSQFVYKSTEERLCKPVVLDFDEFMVLSKATDAKPLIVVAYDAMYNTKTQTRPTKQQLITNAVEWVRYANVVNKFGIKYWMIGNESWNDPEYNGRVSASKYAADLYEFARAMKAVDPSIKIVANGKTDWWPTLLKSKAVGLIDILAFSAYPVYNYSKGYETYRSSSRSLITDVEAAIKAINTYAPSAHKARIKVLAAEYNSMDWGGGWSNANNLGHALFNFQMFGDMIVNPKVESACLWGTRWITNATDEQHIFDALNKDGDLNATGMGLQVWGKNLLHTMVATTSGSSKIKVYATYDTLKKYLTIFLLNKDTYEQSISLSIRSYLSDYSGYKYVFKGTSVSDKNPTYGVKEAISGAASITKLKLGPASVTVLKLGPSMPPSLTMADLSAVHAEAKIEQE